MDLNPVVASADRRGRDRREDPGRARARAESRPTSAGCAPDPARRGDGGLRAHGRAPGDVRPWVGRRR